MTSKEWVDYFIAVYKRKPTPEEFAKAKAQGEFETRPQHIEEKYLKVSPQPAPFTPPEKQNRFPILWVLVLLGCCFSAFYFFTRPSNHKPQTTATKPSQEVSKEAPVISGEATFYDDFGDGITVHIEHTNWMKSEDDALEEAWEKYIDADSDMFDRYRLSDEYYLVGEVSIENVSESTSYDHLDAEVELEIRDGGETVPVSYLIDYSENEYDYSVETFQIDPSFTDDDWGPVGFVISANDLSAETKLLINGIIDDENDLSLDTYSGDVEAKYGDDTSIDHVRTTIQKQLSQ